MIFVNKPVIYIRFEDIGLAKFHRMSATSKLFDLELKSNINKIKIHLN
jgi:hypothetical protein